jgi:chromosome partitioning protein
VTTIAVANHKGGVGKTTTAVALAHGPAIKGHDVVILDLDPQGQCASFLGCDHEPWISSLLVGYQLLTDVVRSTGREHSRLVPGDRHTVTLAASFRLPRTGV